MFLFSYYMRSMKLGNWAASAEPAWGPWPPSVSLWRALYQPFPPVRYSYSSPTQCLDSPNESCPFPGFGNAAERKQEMGFGN